MVMMMMMMVAGGDAEENDEEEEDDDEAGDDGAVRSVLCNKMLPLFDWRPWVVLLAFGFWLRYSSSVVF